jgi:hypothetical protein
MKKEFKNFTAQNAIDLCIGTLVVQAGLVETFHRAGLLNKQSVIDVIQEQIDELKSLPDSASMTIHALEQIRKIIIAGPKSVPNLQLGGDAEKSKPFKLVVSNPDKKVDPDPSE